MKAHDIIKFAKVIGLSKRIKRAGWIREKITDPESIADHSFRLIVMSMALAKTLKVN